MTDAAIHAPDAGMCTAPLHLRRSGDAAQQVRRGTAIPRQPINRPISAGCRRIEHRVEIGTGDAQQTKERHRVHPSAAGLSRRQTRDQKAHRVCGMNRRCPKFPLRHFGPGWCNEDRNDRILRAETAIGTHSQNRFPSHHCPDDWLCCDVRRQDHHSPMKNQHMASANPRRRQSPGSTCSRSGTCRSSGHIRCR